MTENGQQRKPDANRGEKLSAYALLEGIPVFDQEGARDLAEYERRVSMFQVDAVFLLLGEKLKRLELADESRTPTPEEVKENLRTTSALEHRVRVIIDAPNPEAIIIRRKTPPPTPHEE